MNTSIKRLLVSAVLLAGTANLSVMAWPNWFNKGQSNQAQTQSYTYPSSPDMSMTSTTAPNMIAPPVFPRGVAGCPNFQTPPAFPVTTMQYPIPTTQVYPNVTGGAAVVRPMAGAAPVMPIMPIAPITPNVTGEAATVSPNPCAVCPPISRSVVILPNSCQSCPPTTGAAAPITTTTPAQNWPPTCTFPGSCPGYTISIPAQTPTGGATVVNPPMQNPCATPSCPTPRFSPGYITPPPGVTGKTSMVPSNAQFASIMPVASVIPVCNKSPKSTQQAQYSTGGAAGLSVNPPAAASSRPPTPLGTQVVGDYRINLQEEPAKGWYEWQNGQLVWMPPAANTNIHLEVPLLEAQGNRPLPDARVMTNIYNQNNALVDSKQMIMLWDPRGNHYGNNFTIPSAGNYTVRVQVTPPQFARHDINLGKRFSQPATATFTNVKLTPLGQTNT